MAIIKEREKKGIKIDWQLSKDSARSKLNKHFQQVNAENPHCTGKQLSFQCSG
jgi:hypothetical protein